MTTREWLVVIGVAIVGGVATMVYRAMTMALRFVMSVAVQSVSALVFWGAIGLAVVFLLRWSSSRRRAEER